MKTSGKLLSILLIICAPAIAFAQDSREANELERKGIEAKSQRDFEAARTYLKQAAELGYYQAQVDYAFLLETAPPPVQNLIEAYGWYGVIATHPDGDFGKQAQLKIKEKIPAADRAKMEDTATELVNRFGR